MDTGISTLVAIHTKWTFPKRPLSFV